MFGFTPYSSQGAGAVAYTAGLGLFTPSPHAGFATVEKSVACPATGAAGLKACQAALIGLSAPPTNVRARVSILPLTGRGVELPALKRGTPVGNVRSPSRLPSPFITSKLSCSYRIPAPPRITVFPLPNTSQANPTRGEKLLWSPWYGLLDWTMPRIGSKLAINPSRS